MNRNLTFQEIWNRQTIQVQRYCRSYLSKKFGLNIDIDEDTARAIALTTLSKGESIWLDGNEKLKSQLSVYLRLQEQVEAE